MSRCSICHSSIQADEESTSCPVCRNDYHRSCWDELGGCATYGCSEAVEAVKPAPVAVAGQGWGDSKQCPQCEAMIGASLLLCRCGARFPYADPMTPGEYRDWQAHRESVRSLRVLVIVLFFVSLLGVPAPLSGAICGVSAHRNRELLAGADGTYLAMGYGAAALGVVYLITWVLLLVFRL